MTGPRSFLSICSRAGVDWVTGKTKVPCFEKSATRFIRDVIRRIKLERKISADRAPEPDAESAGKYIKAYFEEAYVATFGVVHRPWFGSRFRAHEENPRNDDEPSWYALRNIIYALGCRIEMSKRTTFTNAAQMSWPYFENALSMHTDILYMPASVVGVQALVLMVRSLLTFGRADIELLDRHITPRA